MLFVEMLVVCGRFCVIEGEDSNATIYVGLDWFANSFNFENAVEFDFYWADEQELSVLHTFADENIRI